MKVTFALTGFALAAAAFNAGVWYMDIDTTAEVKVYPEAGGSAKVKFDVDIDPWVYNIGIAYKF